MSKSTLGAIALMVGLTLAVSGVAQRPDRGEGRERRGAPQRDGRGPGQADVNGDGKVSFEELTAIRPEMTRERFDRMDRNGDGFLSRDDRPHAEGPEGPRPYLREKLEQADANADEQVTFKELRAVLPNVDKEQFKRLDRNGDGVLSKADRGRGPGRQPPGTQGPGQRRGGARGPGLQPPGPEGLGPRGERPPLLKKIQQADTDGNGEVTYEELAAALPRLDRERFARMDQNGDGVISKADRQGMPRPGRRDPRRGQGTDTPRPRKKPQEIDANGDGRVTYDELHAACPKCPREIFDRLDRNADGVLSADDFRGRRGRPVR